MDQDAADAPDVGRWCARLGLDATLVRPLTAGQSGATVLEVRAPRAGLAVLKVTTSPRRLAAARREVHVLRGPAQRPVPCAPAVIASTSGPTGVAVALARCEPYPDTAEVTRDDWLEVAAAVARVHRRLGSRDAVALEQREPPSHHRPHPGWRALGCETAAALGATLLAHDPLDRLPLVLEHGDCHVANIVRDARGRTLLVDWQDARLGDGLADLVFCWQRAEFVGARPPRGEMTAAYAAERGLDEARLAPLLDRTELRLLLRAWPPYLAWGSAAGRRTMVERLQALTGPQSRLR